MSPSPDPPADAVALFRTVLANPDDETPRLVFADWLEDTGVPANVAWAEYLRIHTTAGGRDPARAADLAPRIKARLTLSAWTFRRHCELVLALLPADRVTVRLTHFWPDHHLIGDVPESVVRESAAIPIVNCDGRFIFATASVAPGSQERLTFVLSRKVDFVQADVNEVEALIDTCYGQTETESMTVTYVSPMVALEGEANDPARQSLYTIFQTAFENRWTEIVVSRRDEQTAVSFQADHIETPEEMHPIRVFDILLEHLLSLEHVEALETSHGRHIRIVDVPMLGGHTRRWIVTADEMPPTQTYVLSLRDWLHPEAGPL